MNRIIGYRFRVYGKGIAFRVECGTRDRNQVVAAMTAQGYQLTLLAVKERYPAELPYETSFVEWIGAN